MDWIGYLTEIVTILPSLKKRLGLPHIPLHGRSCFCAPRQGRPFCLGNWGVRVIATMDFKTKSWSSLEWSKSIDDHRIL